MFPTAAMKMSWFNIDFKRNVTDAISENCPNPVFCGPYFPIFGLNMEIYEVNSVQMRENTNQKNSAFRQFLLIHGNLIRKLVQRVFDFALLNVFCQKKMSEWWTLREHLVQGRLKRWTYNFAHIILTNCCTKICWHFFW